MINGIDALVRYGFQIYSTFDIELPFSPLGELFDDVFLVVNLRAERLDLKATVAVIV
jgi:hypothetical protein